MGFLSGPEVARLRHVCRAFSDFGSGEWLWRNLLLSDFKDVLCHSPHVQLSPPAPLKIELQEVFSVLQLRLNYLQGVDYEHQYKSLYCMSQPRWACFVLPGESPVARHAHASAVSDSSE